MGCGRVASGLKGSLVYCVIVFRMLLLKFGIILAAVDWWEWWEKGASEARLAS